jgi:hypothetical protein
MKSLLEGVITQHIDTNGKTRVLNYENVSLAVSPLPILDVPEVGMDMTISSNVKVVLEFLERKKLDIVEQHGNEGKIQGVWVRSLEKPPIITFGYIPIDLPENEDENNAIDGVPYSDENVVDPLFVGEDSELNDMRKNERLAEYLKQFSLWEYSNANPNQISMKNFYVNDEYEYEGWSGTGFKFDRNNTFYYGKKLIVPDEETAKRIILFVETSVFNDYSIPIRYRNKKNMDNSLFFSTINDFRKEHKQLIFMGREAVLRWKLEVTREISNSNVHSHPRPLNKEPYYYRNFSIKGGALMIIQNTKRKDLPSALVVSYFWENPFSDKENIVQDKSKGINIGYNPKTDVIETYRNITYYDVYTEKGITYTGNKKSSEIVKSSVFAYENGNYAAILFL